MKTLIEYIEESLLDDIDDLEKDSDDMVKWKTSIGGEYYVRYVMVFNIGSTLKELDKQKIKKLTYKYNDDGYKIYTQAGKVAKNPNIKYIDTLVRCIMDLENCDSDVELKSRIEEFLKPLLKCAFAVKLTKRNTGKIRCIRIGLYNGFDEIEISISKR
jgi:hypothetical protein